MLNLEVRQAIAKAAKQGGYDPAKLAAIIEVESAGIVFWNVRGDLRPSLRPEGHYFYRLTQGATRDKAVAAGLASPRYLAVKVPNSYVATYDMFQRMCDIDRNAAIMSCSWGIGQVMGEYWHRLGYETIDAFLAAQNTLEGQIDCLLRELKADNLDRALAEAGFSADSWRPFAKGYNGVAYARLGYHIKIARAYGSYFNADFGLTKPVEPVPSGIVKAIQGRLAALGAYAGPVDGLESQALTEAIRIFQRDHGLVADGLYGPMTENMVTELEVKKAAKEHDSAVVTGAQASGLAATGQLILNTVQGVIGSVASHAFQGVLVVLLVVGVVLIIYGLVRKHQAEVQKAAEAEEALSAAKFAAIVETEVEESER